MRAKKGVFRLFFHIIHVRKMLRTTRVMRLFKLKCSSCIAINQGHLRPTRPPFVHSPN